MTDRAREQADLLFHLGTLLGPFEELVQHPDRFTPSERSRVGAKYYAERNDFLTMCTAFCNNEPGYIYDRERYQAHYALGMFDSYVREHLDSPVVLGERLMATREAIKAALLRVPTDHGTSVLIARTPFTTALALRNRLETASSHVTLIDRYVDESVYFRLLSSVDVHVDVVVVTWPEEKQKTSLWLALRNVAALFATERPGKTQLLTAPEIHARWLQVDDRCYVISESFKDAGFKAPLSISLAEGMSGLDAQIREVVSHAVPVRSP